MTEEEFAALAQKLFCTHYTAIAHIEAGEEQWRALDDFNRNAWIKVAKVSQGVEIEHVAINN